MHDQTIYHGYFLSIMQSLHFTSSQCSQSEGESKEDGKTPLFSWFADVAIFNKKVVTFVYRTSQSRFLVYGLAHLDWNMRKSSLACKEYMTPS